MTFLIYSDYYNYSDWISTIMGIYFHAKLILHPSNRENF